METFKWLNYSPIISKLPFYFNGFTTLFEFIILKVRKTAQATLLVLVEQGLVDSSVIEETVCPIIITLTENDSLIEYQSGTVAVSMRKYM